MKYVIETLTKITKDWSDIDSVYKDLTYIKDIVKDYILSGKDYFYVYDLICSQITLIELGVSDDFEGRIFRDSVYKLSTEIGE